MIKHMLRQQLLLKRQGLSKAEVKYLSQAISIKLLSSINWKKVNSLHYYSSIENLNEVDLDYFIVRLKIINPKINLFTNIKVGDFWRVKAIKKDQIIPESYDVIIVPMLGFDQTLNRLGYGGGFYDKFLDSKLKAVKIGVCYEQGFMTEFCSEEHDIAMNIIVTENKILSLTG